MKSRLVSKRDFFVLQSALKRILFKCCAKSPDFEVVLYKLAQSQETLRSWEGGIVRETQIACFKIIKSRLVLY